MAGLRKFSLAGLGQAIAILLLTAPFFAAAAQDSPDVTTAAAIPTKPPTPLSPEQMGDLMMVEHRYVAALNAYQSVPEKLPVVWNKMGMAYHHLFALEEARKDYETAIKLDPNYSEALNNLGAVYHGQQRYKEAERVYKRALRIHPQAVVYCNLGTTFFAEHKYGDGVKAYQKAFAVDPKVFSPAETALVQSGSSAEQRVAVNYSMAKLYARAGEEDLALASLRKALSNGFKDRKRLFEDTEFAGLRETAGFQQLLTEENLQ